MATSPLAPRRHPPARKRSEAGYNMVMLIVALTVLNIMIAAMMPLMSTEIQREKEEELIFRGFQYAEAIRIFHLRFQRFPTKLEELIEIKPRCIRQLWKDPMTKDGKWGLIFQGQGVPLNPQNPQNPEGQQPSNVNPQDPEGRPSNGQDGNGLNTPKQGDEVAIGPIVGVYSKSPRDSHLVFYGHQRYDEWRFTFDLIPNGGVQRPSVVPGVGNPGQVLAPSFSTRWLGRPMYLVDQQQFQPQNGTLPGQQPGTGTGSQTQPGGGKRPSSRL
jgi:type II secretory pathway pseudopilin PulG